MANTSILNPQYQNTQTPCIGICSTVYGDEVCRGCKRTCQEVIDWNGYSQAQKSNVLLRLDQTICKLSEHFFEVTDIAALQGMLTTYQITVNDDASPTVWAILLLGSAAENIPNATACGLKIKSPYTSWPLRQLINTLDTKIYQTVCSKLTAG